MSSKYVCIGNGIDQFLSSGSSAGVYLARQQQADPSNLRESTSQWHFLAFFASGMFQCSFHPLSPGAQHTSLAGLFSSLVSHVATARFKYPQLIAQLASCSGSTTSSAAVAEGAAAARSTSAFAGGDALASIKPSLGASGAIYATVTLTAMAFPEAHVSLIFPPTPPIPIQYGVFGFMAMDLLGVIRGWRSVVFVLPRIGNGKLNDSRPPQNIRPLRALGWRHVRAVVLPVWSACLGVVSGDDPGRPATVPSQSVADVLLVSRRTHIFRRNRTTHGNDATCQEWVVRGT